MKRALLVISALLLAVSLNAQRLRVGLVLGGGGAKGAATISILKEIEASGIPVDYIAGTSIGALIGGLYASGYTAAEIEKIYMDVDWWTIGQGDKVYKLLERLLKDKGVKRFRDTRIPFRCVATDMDDNMREIVLGEDPDDELATAMRASMSVPIVYKPVKWHGRRLTDGGMVNNLPVDVAREMGAEVIIAVDLQQGEESPIDLPSILDGVNFGRFGKAGQLTEWLRTRSDLPKYRQNVEDADFYIHPTLEGYHMASFGSDDRSRMLELGREALRDYLHRTAMGQLRPQRHDMSTVKKFVRAGAAATSNLHIPEE